MGDIESDYKLMKMIEILLSGGSIKADPLLQDDGLYTVELQVELHRSLALRDYIAMACGATIETIEA